MQFFFFFFGGIYGWECSYALHYSVNLECREKKNIYIYIFLKSANEVIHNSICMTKVYFIKSDNYVWRL